MTTMVYEIYDALKEAGASDEKAQKAAEAVANHELRFAKFEGEMMLLKWMLGFNLAFTCAILWRVFTL